MSNVDKLKVQPFKHESIDTMNWYMHSDNMQLKGTIFTLNPILSS